MAAAVCARPIVAGMHAAMAAALRNIADLRKQAIAGQGATVTVIIFDLTTADAGSSETCSDT